MQGSSLARVREIVGWSGDALLVHVAGLATTVLIPCLLIVLGFVVEIVALIEPGRLTGYWLPFVGPQLLWLTSSIFGLAATDLREYLWFLLATGLALALCEAISIYIYLRAVDGAALDVATQLRQSLVRQAYQVGASDLLGTLTTRPEELFVRQTEQIREALVAWWNTVPRAAVLAAMLLIMALWVNWTITLVAIIFAALAYLLYRWLLRQAADDRRIHADRLEIQERLIVDRLRLAPLVSGYALLSPPGEPIDAELQRLKAHGQATFTSDSTILPVMVAFAIFAGGVIALLVGYQSLQGMFSAAGGAVLGAALLCAYWPATRLMSLSSVIEEGDAAAADLLTYLDRDTRLVEVAGARVLPRLADKLQLDNVKLADRGGKMLLDGVSLSIPARKRVAIVSSDPQAAIAIAGLFVRLYDPAAGRVLVDGQDLTRATLASLRKECLLVPDDGMLFTATVSDNISAGDERFSLLQITDAAKLARAYDFVQQLPQGFATQIGAHAMHLQPGQAFRIGLARAALRNPSLLVVHEPGEGMEEATATQIDEGLRRIGQDCTLVMVARQVETLRSADRVYLFHEGKLQAEGTHAELVQSSDLYRHLTYIRFNNFRDKVRE